MLSALKIELVIFDLLRNKKMSRKGMIERLKNVKCSEDEKKALGEYLFSCLAEGRKFRLKRDRKNAQGEVFRA